MPAADQTIDRNPSQTLPGSVVLCLFFLSGFSALIYEIIWFRQLATVFGATVYATTTVLSSFMGGLALGSFLFGRIADRSKNPLKLYALLEVGIGVFAVLFPAILKFYDNLYVAAYQKVSLNFYSFSLIRFAACSVVLIIPTTLMGGTFPVMSKYFVRNAQSLTRDIGNLYAINTVGAVAGILCAGFFLIPYVGIRTATVVAVCANFAVGGIAFALSRAKPPKSGVRRHAPSQPVSNDAQPVRVQRLVLAAVFISGATALAYEVLWTRTLVFILDSFVYSFSIMLATFLAGLSIGSFAISILSGRLKHAYIIFCVLEIAVGLATMLVLPFFTRIAVWKETFLQSISAGVSFDAAAPWGKYVLFKFLVSFSIMAAPTFMMGAAFPLAMKLYTNTLGTVGRKVGIVYASNTLGAIVGSFAAGFILVPFVGLRNAFILAAGFNVAAGAVLLALQPQSPLSARLIRCTAALAAFVVAIMFVPGDMYQKIFQKAEKEYDLVYYKEDPTATVTVHKRGKDRLIIDLNGLNVAGTSFNFLTTQKIQAHLGLLLHPSPKRVMQIGFGSGGTCYSASLHGGVASIDCVEICPAVIEAAKYFLPSNHRVLEKPTVHLHIEDARNYMLATPDRYDLILSDSIHPTYAGNGTLYSRDYFELCRNKLNDGGFVSFWLPTYLLSVRDYKTIIKTFQSVFPYVTIWYVHSAIEAYTIVIGKTQPFTIDVRRIRSRMADPDIARDLAAINAFDEYDILSYFIMGPETARAFAADGDINSENTPIIEFRAPKSMSRRRTWYQNLKALAEHRESPIPYLVNSAETDAEKNLFLDELQKRFTLAGLLINGHLINIITFSFDQELQYYTRASQIAPGNRTVQRLKSLAESRVSVLHAESAFSKKQYPEAAAFYERAISVNPDPADDSVGHSLFKLGAIYAVLGNPEQAERMIERCLEIFPNHKNALMLSANLARKTGHAERASLRIKRLRFLYPYDADVRSLAH